MGDTSTMYFLYELNKGWGVAQIELRHSGIRELAELEVQIY